MAGILAAFWGVLLGFPVLRSAAADYLAIVTLAFGRDHPSRHHQLAKPDRRPQRRQQHPAAVFLWHSDSPRAMTALQPNSASSFRRPIAIVFLFYIILALALLTNWVTIRLRRLPIGRAWEALREDEVACRALGINNHHDKADGIRHRRHVRRFRRRLLRDTTRLHQPRILHLQESALVLAIVVLGWHGLTASASRSRR